MIDAPDLVVVDEDAQVRVVGEQARDKLRNRPGQYRLMVGLSGVLVLCQDNAASAASGGERVLVAGEIISAGTMVEVINLIAAQRWRGQLQVFSGDSHRVLIVDSGVLKYAQSSDPEDRLDHIIRNLGLVDPIELQRATAEAGTVQRLGRVLVERKLLDEAALSECLHAQVQQVFFSTLLVSEGRYLFSIPDHYELTPDVIVHLPVHSMLLEGVGRIDEMASSPDAAAAKVVTWREEGAPFAPEEPDQPPVESQTREAGPGAEPSTRPALDEAEVREETARTNEVLRQVFAAAACGGGLGRTREILKMWIHDTGYVTYLGDGFLSSGNIDPAHVLRALHDHDIGNPMHVLRQGLHDLVICAVFAASAHVKHAEERVRLLDLAGRLAATVMSPPG